jgi:Uma2 family endonuclease
MALRADKPIIERLFTSDEFEQLPEFDERYELIDGRLREKEVPGFQHAIIADRIKDAIRDFDRSGELGLAAREASVRLGPKNTPLPDLSFWKAGRVPALTKGAAPRPDLIVEVLSPRDIETKRRWEEVQTKIRKYQIAGVQIIWVVNPRKKTVEVYHYGQIEPVDELGLDDQLDGEEVIPGFTLPVRALFD